MLSSSLRPKARPASLDTEPASKVARNATDQVRLNLHKPILLGTFGPPSNLRALVRLPSGKVSNLARGDRFGSATVLAVSQDTLTLTNGRLALP